MFKITLFWETSRLGVQKWTLQFVLLHASILADEGKNYIWTVESSVFTNRYGYRNMHLPHCSHIPVNVLCSAVMLVLGLELSLRTFFKSLALWVLVLALALTPVLGPVVNKDYSIMEKINSCFLIPHVFWQFSVQLNYCLKKWTQLFSGWSFFINNKHTTSISGFYFTFSQ